MASIYRYVRSYSDVGDVLVCAAKNSTVEEFNRTLSAANWDHAQQLGLYAKVFPGDPIICTKNHYNEGLVNGMLGVVKSIGDEILVAWEGEPVDPDTGRSMPKIVPQKAAIDIRLAYAITCHKSQGSAAPTVIVALEDTTLITREWLYTAVTRARYQVILVGRQKELRKAAARRTLRTTGFNPFSKEMHT
ncbi:ATP-binding domain-containing protein [Sulfitobacter sp. 1A13191]|uniref:ATP-binding domain-containing protein n=1 Tax=Sulfitobacter sp. 1A13191 TaxID=3368589 RepID=UPI0037469B74